MSLSLPPELDQRVETEIAFGDFQSSNQLVEEAIRQFLDARRGNRRIAALDRIAQAVDDAGLSDRVYLPSDDDDE